MSEELQIYIAYIVIIPILITFIIGYQLLIPEGWGFLVIVYFLSLISTHLVGNKIQSLSVKGN